jgi:hypothetical protein
MKTSLGVILSEAEDPSRPSGKAFRMTIMETFIAMTKIKTVFNVDIVPAFPYVGIKNKGG